MELINRLWNWTVYLWSMLLTGVGMMTQKDWLAFIAALTGIVVAVLGELHRRRMSRIHETNNVLLNELIDAIRDDTENRQDVKELIRLSGSHRDEKRNYCLFCCGDCFSRSGTLAADAAHKS